MAHMRVEMINNVYFAIKLVRHVLIKKTIVHHVLQIKIESLKQEIFVYAKMDIMKNLLL